jgi:molybdopterin converting factor small subunit
MLVKVYAPAFCSHDLILDNGCVELCEGTTLIQLLKKLEMPILLRRMPIVFVNYDRVKLSAALKDGDTVSILGMVASG